MPNPQNTTFPTAIGNMQQHLVPFLVHIQQELQLRIQSFTRTDEERMKFTQNALAMLADVYEGKRKMPGYTFRQPEVAEEPVSFF